MTELEKRVVIYEVIAGFGSLLEFGTNRCVLRFITCVEQSMPIMPLEYQSVQKLFFALLFSGTTECRCNLLICLLFACLSHSFEFLYFMPVCEFSRLNNGNDWKYPPQQAFVSCTIAK